MSARRRSWAASVNQATGDPEAEPAPWPEGGGPLGRGPEGGRPEGGEAAGGGGSKPGPAVSDAPAEDEEGDGPEPPAADRAAP
ncbi:hypothetical protein GCM10009639_24610 [Kitasatospora putterlickiae]|uniref:Uncharacterized protein n=1 Tax=Kitasatospora putterlickiae TaxID=221725 RepID=A0ABN1XY28_9ACTN